MRPKFKNVKNLREDLSLRDLQIAVEYYNQKYPERGKIHHLIIDHSKIRDMEDLAKKFSQLQVNNILPIKIVFSLFDNNLLGHSQPFVLTEDKLISMRDFRDFSTLGEELGRNLGIKYIEPHIESQANHKSIQRDYTSCHFIALGILKDLNATDLEKVSEFEDGYKPLAKSLKYSQSREYNNEMFTAETRREVINKRGMTVEKYQTKHGPQRSILGCKTSEHRNRIASKAQRFIADLDSVDEQVSDLPAVALRIIEKRRLAKEASKNHSCNIC